MLLYLLYNILFFLWKHTVGSHRTSQLPHNTQKRPITTEHSRTTGRFEIRNFKNKISVLMCLSYLVENFFLVILRGHYHFFVRFFWGITVLKYSTYFRKKISNQFKTYVEKPSLDCINENYDMLQNSWKYKDET